ncbi:MAG: class I SAM-dependent methyltransferase [Eubacteriales bacterium]|nr:class I SAM-dependent methyltransferase [Eubacteriales bacterium]
MYTAFATVYDRLMAEVDYQKWARFYEALLLMYDVRPGAKACECACGTGSLTIALAGLGFQMTGVDLSPDMLFEASQKARKAGAMIPFIKQDMRALHLHRQMDAVLCTCDGVNYLKGEQEVLEFFGAAFNALRPGGALMFDLSTPYKLQHVLGDSFIGDESADLAYLWKNHWRPDKNCVDMALSIFTRTEGETYQRVGEVQRQFAYDFDQLTRLLGQTGFESIRRFGDRRFSPCVPEEQRWHICARKPLLPEEGERV